jgi:hypothetical protein
MGGAAVGGIEPGRAPGANSDGRARPPKPKNGRGGLQKLSPRSARLAINSSVILTSSTTGCLALAQNFFTACRVWPPSLPSMRPLRQSSRRSSLCAFLNCSGELAGNAAGASAAGSWLWSAALPASEAFCAMRPVATAPAGSVHSEIAITANPARQTRPCIANIFHLISALPTATVDDLAPTRSRSNQPSAIQPSTRVMARVAMPRCGAWNGRLHFARVLDVVELERLDDFAEIIFNGLCCKNATAWHNLYIVKEKISEAYFLVLRPIFT